MCLFNFEPAQYNEHRRCSERSASSCLCTSTVSITNACACNFTAPAARTQTRKLTNAKNAETHEKRVSSHFVLGFRPLICFVTHRSHLSHHSHSPLSLITLTLFSSLSSLISLSSLLSSFTHTLFSSLLSPLCLQIPKPCTNYREKGRTDRVAILGGFDNCWCGFDWLPQLTAFVGMSLMILLLFCVCSRRYFLLGVAVTQVAVHVNRMSAPGESKLVHTISNHFFLLCSFSINSKCSRRMWRWSQLCRFVLFFFGNIYHILLGTEKVV